MKRTPFYVLLLTIFLMVACNKTETPYVGDLSEPLPSPQAKATPVEQSETPTPPPLRGGAHTDIPDLSGAMVIVPDMVKGKWKSVVLMLEDKKTHAITEHTIDLGQEWTIPDSEIVVKVGTFLPDLIIQGTVFTSVSNELKNPAIHVTILSKGQELYEGWLFSLFPTMHAFQHDRYAITLKDVIAS